MDAEDEEFEQKPLEGMLVEIYGLEAPLEPSLETKAAQPGVEPTDMNGARGRALGWSSKDRKYIVETFDGFIAGVAEENLREFPPQEPEGGGFDVAWPSGNVPPDLFAEEVLDVLSQKGYCMIQMFTAPGTREKAREEAFDLTQWHLTTKELEVPYMGYENSTKYANLEGDLPDRECEDALAQCDRTLTNLGVMLCPLIPEYLGFDVYARSNGMVRVPLMGPAEEDMLRPEPLAEHDYDSGGKVYGHLNFMKRRKLFLLYFVDNEGGTLTLHPSPDHGSSTPIEIPIQKNRLVVFRPDIMTYTYKPRGESLLLQTWYVTAPLMQSMESPKVVQLPVNQQNQRAHVQSIQMRFAGGAHGPETGWSMWLTGTDGAVKIPKLRWDIDVYYNPEIYGMSYTVHSACIDETVVQSFDNEFFKIPHDEANVMSPGARNLLEVGYHTLNSAGYTKQNVNGEKVGVYIGNAGTDWVWRNGGIMYEGAMSGNMSPWVNSGTNPGMINARISHNLGLKGPIVTCDTACSSSLVALGQAHAAMRQTMKGSQRTPTSYSQLSKAMVMGLCLDDGPQTFLAYCAATMLSVGGRSFTFDESANGFLRGEGIGGAFIKRSDSDEDANSMYACVIGCNVNQDGRSASMTAPNGPSQQICIKASMIEAGVSASQITIAECHGTGTALGDPIEVGTLRGVFRKRETCLPITSAKTHMGHLETGAGSVGILKTILSINHGCVPANAHLRQLTSHAETEAFPAAFPVEAVTLRTAYHHAGANGFGFGGTNARVDLWARRLHRVRKGPEVGGAAGSPGRQLAFMDRLDFVAVPCQRCLGPMCWLCGMAVPADVRPGKHHCKVIRDEFASYDVCSACHELAGGGYQLAQPEEDFGGHTRLHGKVYLVGTWNAWSRPLEMEHLLEGATDDVYEADIALGETCLEQFHLRLPSGDVFHPEVRMAGPDVHVVGPSRAGAQKHWLVDGRRDGAEAGAVYRVRFTWGNSLKTVSWAVVDQPPPAAAPASFQHAYYFVSSLGRWSPVEMERDGGEPGVWTISGRMPQSGEAEFFFMRDKDDTQMIYPLSERPTEDSVPVMGPDEGGLGKRWLALATAGEMLTVQLRVGSGRISVSAFTDTMGKMVWESAPGRSRRVYSVTGSWNSWGFSQMLADDDDPGVHRCLLVIGPDGFEEFRVAVNQNKSTTLHPANDGEAPGRGFAVGPDDEGHRKNWHIFGPPGSMLEVTLNLGAADRCRRVTCAPC
mmetsp:Transcript_74513/g.210476  ORF Transcript_74513/g.210476 Transcript_74513/m.210476 type:complete len:1235 (-) Transcript_74513:224-3928(-)